MLGESHALLIEFSRYKTRILALVEKSEEFLAQMQKYDALDAEIRALELANSPIDDLVMQDKKRTRADLKDRLHRIIVSA